MGRQYKINPLEYGVKIHIEDGSLKVLLETPDLLIRSPMSADKEDLTQLFGCASVMKTFAEGKTFSEKKSQGILETWVAKFAKCNPLSGYAVLEKSSGKFVGMLVIHQKDQALKNITLGYALHADFQGKGYGTQAVKGFFTSLIPNLLMRSRQLELQPDLFKMEFVATALKENIASQKILRKAGFVPKGEVKEYESERYSFGKSAKALLRGYHQFFINRAKLDERAALLLADQKADCSAYEMRYMLKPNY